MSKMKHNDVGLSDSNTFEHKLCSILESLEWIFLCSIDLFDFNVAALQNVTAIQVSIRPHYTGI